MKNILVENLNYLKSIVHWILWWLLATSCIIIVVILSFIIPRRFWNSLVKISCMIMMYSIFIFPRIKGYDKNKLPFPVIFVANHVSFFDLFISGTVLPGYPRGFEMASHFYMPIYGWFIKRFGQIPVEAGNMRSLRKAILNSENILKNKVRNIYVAPEGSRTINGKIGKFRSGAFYLAIKTGVPIVPVVYKNLYSRNNKNTHQINYGFFDVVFLEPVYPENYKNENSLCQFIKQIMEDELKRS